MLLNHVSLGVKDPANVAKVLAELIKGSVYPFPPVPNGFVVFSAGDDGSAFEIVPWTLGAVPGKDSDNPWEAGGHVVKMEGPSYITTHVNMNTPLSREEVMAIAQREGWRTLVINRGEAFTAIEFWIENRILCEVLTPEETKRYLSVYQPHAWMKQWEGGPPPGAPGPPPGM
jgi:hypothetical protein